VPTTDVPDPSTVSALGPVETILAVASVLALAQWVRIIRQVTTGQQELAAKQTGLPA